MSNHLNGFVPDFMNTILAQSSPENPAFAGLLGPEKDGQYAATFDMLQNPTKQARFGLRYRLDKLAGKVDPDLLELYNEMEDRRAQMVAGAKLYKRVNDPKALNWIDGAIYGLRVLLLTGRTPRQERGNGTGERFVYDAQCNDSLPGKEYCSETKAASKADKDLDAMFEFMRQVRKVLLEVFGKNSIDGQGMRIKSSGHYSNTGNRQRCEYDNAFWNGYMFVCGNASKKVFLTFVLLTVVAHEIFHGVENKLLPSWNDSYYGEQGAAMEAFADFGAFVVTQIMNGWDIATAAKKENGGFQVGRGIFMPQVQGYCLRDALLKPGEYEYNDPVIGKSHQTRHMNEIYHGEADRGGVHWNATIFTRFFALWCVLGGGDIVKYARVWFNGHTKMKSTMNFQQRAEAIGSVCKNSELELYPKLREAGNEVGLILPGNPTILVP